MRVFISYSNRDGDFVKELASQLSQEGCRVWYADQEVMPGQNWSLAVGKALEKADAMVIVLSPDAVKSPSVLREIEYALGSPKFEGRLIPVEVRRTKRMPWILRQLHVIRASRDPGGTARRIVAQLNKSAAMATA
jgi:hypothetical protein